MAVQVADVPAPNIDKSKHSLSGHLILLQAGNQVPWRLNPHSLAIYHLKDNVTARPLLIRSDANSSKA